MNKLERISDKQGETLSDVLEIANVGPLAVGLEAQTAPKPLKIRGVFDVADATAQVPEATEIVEDLPVEEEEMKNSGGASDAGFVGLFGEVAPGGLSSGGIAAGIAGLAVVGAAASGGGGGSDIDGPQTPVGEDPDGPSNPPTIEDPSEEDPPVQDPDTPKFDSNPPAGTPNAGNSYGQGIAPEGDIATVDTGLIVPLNGNIDDPMGYSLLHTESDFQGPQAETATVNLGGVTLAEIGELRVLDLGREMQGDPVSGSPDTMSVGVDLGPVYIEQIILYPEGLQSGLPQAGENLQENLQNGGEVDRLVGLSAVAGNFYDGDRFQEETTDNPALFVSSEPRSLLIQQTTSDGEGLALVSENGNKDNGEAPTLVQVGQAEVLYAEDLMLVTLDGNLNDGQSLDRYVAERVEGLSNLPEGVSVSEQGSVVVDFDALDLQDLASGKLAVNGEGFEQFAAGIQELSESDTLLATTVTQTAGSSAESESPALAEVVTAQLEGLAGAAPSGESGSGFDPEMLGQITSPIGAGDGGAPDLDAVSGLLMG